MDAIKKKKNRLEKRIAKKQKKLDGIKGSCEAGDLKACKSEVAKTPSFDPNKSRFNLNTVGDPQKRKKMQEKIDKLKKKQKLKDEKNNPGRHSNPRFL